MMLKYKRKSPLFVSIKMLQYALGATIALLRCLFQPVNGSDCVILLQAEDAYVQLCRSVSFLCGPHVPVAGRVGILPQAFACMI